MASALASAASVSFELGDHFGQGLAADGLNFVSTLALKTHPTPQKKRP